MIGFGLFEAHFGQKNSTYRWLFQMLQKKTQEISQPNYFISWGSHLLGHFY